MTRCKIRSSIKNVVAGLLLEGDFGVVLKCKPALVTSTIKLRSHSLYMHLASPTTLLSVSGSRLNLRT